MNEQLDEKLSQAFKQGPGTPLAGWEFTREMQTRVLERIAAEEAAPAPDPKFRPMHLPRPVIWAAVAAAAFFLAIKLPLGGAGSGGAAKPMAPATASAPMAAGAKREEAQPAGGAQTTGAGSSAAKTAAPAAAAPAAPSPQAPRDSAEQTASAQAGQPAPAPMMAGDSAHAEASRSTSPGPGVPTLLGPMNNGEARMSFAAQIPAPRLTSVGGQAAEVLNGLVRGIDSNGAPTWELNLEGAGPGNPVAAAADGRLAVGAGAKVYVISAAGSLERTLEVPDGVSDLGWDAGGRLAAADPAGVTVWRGSRAEFRAGRSSPVRVAFGPDGSLAVLAYDAGSLRLMLYGPDGSQTMEAGPVAEGGSLTFAPDGSWVLANGQAYDRSGELLWQSSLAEPQGQAVSGRVVVAWQAGAAVGLRSSDGAELWRRTWTEAGEGYRSAVADGTGGLTALLAGGDGDGRVTVVDQSGKVLLDEQVPLAPTGAAFVGNRLLISLPNGSIIVKQLPQ